MISWPANGTGSRCAPESLGEMRSLCRTIGECSETIKGCLWFIDESDIFGEPNRDGKSVGKSDGEASPTRN